VTVPEVPRDDIARELKAINVARKALAKREALLNQGLLPRMLPGEKIAAWLDPEDPEGSSLGYVLKTHAAVTAKVTNRPRLIAWTEEHAATEVVTEKRVRESFERTLLEQVKTHGGWVSPNGEVIPVDGVKVETGSSFLRFPDGENDAEQVLIEAIAARRFQLQLLPAPDGGGEAL
jgi:hypothetical protein